MTHSIAVRRVHTPEVGITSEGVRIPVRRLKDSLVNYDAHNNRQTGTTDDWLPDEQDQLINSANSNHRKVFSSISSEILFISFDHSCNWL